MFKNWKTPGVLGGFLRYNKLKIFGILKQALFDSIDVNADQFKLYSEDYIVLFNSEKNRLHFYYKQGDHFALARKIDLAIENKNLSLLKDKSAMISLFDCKTKELFYYENIVNYSDKLDVTVNKISWKRNFFFNIIQ